MTLRRILLGVGTLAVLVAAFLVYRFATRTRTQETRPVPKVEAPELANVGEPGQGPLPQAGRGLEYEDWDEHGLRGVYRSRVWRKNDDGSYTAEGLRVTLYRSGAQEVHLRARRGRVYAEEVARGLHVRHGRLAGDVRVVLDNAAAPDAVPWQQRPETTIRAYVDEITFDNESLEMRTDSVVRIEAPQGEIRGRGLRMQWNEVPRELRLLRLAEGERVTLTDVPEELTMDLPGGEAAREVPPAEPGGAGIAAVAAGGDGTAGGETPQRPAHTARNQYRLEFHRGAEGAPIAVQRGDARIEGMDRLTLWFEWAQETKEVLEAPARPHEAGGEAAQVTEDTAGGDKSADQEAKETAPPLVITWSGPLEITPQGYTETPSRRNYAVEGEGERVRLTDGETLATCRRFRRESPSRSAWLIGTASRPARLILPDGREAQEARAEEIRFDAAKQLADLHGPGAVVRYALADGQEAGALLDMTPAQAAEQAVQQATWTQRAQAHLAKPHADSQETNAGEGGEAEGPDDARRPRLMIRQAELYGSARLQEMADDDTKGGSVSADELRIFLDRGDDGMWRPTRSEADGHCRIQQDTMEITSEHMEVIFADKPAEADETRQAGDAAARSADGEADIWGRLAAQKLTAWGSVRGRDTSDEEPTTLTADRLIVQPQVGWAQLIGTGEPAVIAQGENRLTGKDIRFTEYAPPEPRDGDAQPEYSAVVLGPGELHFLSPRKGDGDERAEPVPITVTWGSQMTYSGQWDVATFEGTVRVASGLNEMRCGSLHLQLELDEPGEAGPAAIAAPAEPAASGRLAVGLEQYGRRRINLMIARRDVRLRAEDRAVPRAGERHGRLLTRSRLLANELHYWPQDKRVRVKGAGSLLTEDYRPPKPRDTRKPTGPLSRSLQRPYQTGFAWSKSLDWSQTDGICRAVLEGRPPNAWTISHASGNRIAGARRFGAADLTAGETLKLACEHLLAEFAAPPEKDTRVAEPAKGGQAKQASLPAEFEDLKVGPMRRFSARRHVNLRYGEKDDLWQAMGQRLVFDRTEQAARAAGGRDVAVLWGYLPGEAKAAASLHHMTRGGRPRSQPVASPRILMYFRDGELVDVQTGRVVGAAATYGGGLDD